MGEWSHGEGSRGGRVTWQLSNTSATKIGMVHNRDLSAVFLHFMLQYQCLLLVCPTIVLAVLWLAQFK